MSQQNEQYASQQGLFADPPENLQQNVGQQGYNPTVSAQSNQPGFPVSGTAAVAIPGQNVDQNLLAAQQGYSNTTGASNLRRQSRGSPQRLSGNVSTLDPNIDWFNKRISNSNPEGLHKLIDQFGKGFDFKNYIDNISYQGFNRHTFVSTSLKVLSVSQFCRLALMGAIRGSNFPKIKDNSLSVDADLVNLFNDGTVVKTPKKKNDISVLRCTASIPQWCAFYMMGADVPPKVADSRLPAYLQFPAAASLPMSDDLRRAHIEFSIKFSMLIGGTFNGNIYLAAFNNQLPLNEIHDTLRMKLGIQSMGESMAVQAQTIITELSTQLIKR